MYGQIVFVTEFTCGCKSVYSSFHGYAMKKEIEEFVVSFVLTEQIASQNNGSKKYFCSFKNNDSIFSTVIQANSKKDMGF